jgi:hypothetical protein
MLVLSLASDNASLRISRLTTATISVEATTNVNPIQMLKYADMLRPDVFFSMTKAPYLAGCLSYSKYYAYILRQPGVQEKKGVFVKVHLKNGLEYGPIHD